MSVATQTVALARPHPSPRPKQGILLNPSPPPLSLHLAPASIPRSHRTPSPTTATASASLDLSRTQTLPTPNVRSDRSPDPAARNRRGSSPLSSTRARAIRFAPLPDPRREVLISESGDELPLPAVFDECDASVPALATFPPTPTSATAQPTAASASSPLVIPALLAPHSLSPVPSRNNSSTSLTLSLQSGQPSNRRRNPSPGRPSSSAGSTPTITKKLLKSFGLTRSSESNITPPPFNNHGHGLSRVSSASSDRTARPARVMLNGRTYGARRNNKNPFANARDVEPEFVEWGQAGMGAVNQQSPWSRITQSGEDPLRGRPQAEEDDGSGMAWLRRRKAERAAKEAEEAKAREHAGEASASSASSTTGSEGVESDGTEATVPEEDEKTVEEKKEGEQKAEVGTEHAVSAVQVKMREEESEDSEEDQEVERDDDEEEEADTEAEECARKTAVGAGVEVISRHHH